MLKLSSRLRVSAFVLACVLVPWSAAWSDPPRVIFWGDPNSAGGEIGQLQLWFPQVVANRFPEDSLIIISHGNSTGVVQVPDAGGYIHSFPGSPFFRDNLRNVFGNRGPGSNTWFAWCNSGSVSCSPTWGDWAAREFPGHNFYTFQQQLRILPKTLDGPTAINPVLFDPTDPNSTAMLFMKSPRIFRHATDERGNPIAFVPLEGPRGQRIVGTGAAVLGRSGNNPNPIQTSIELPPGIIARFATNREDNPHFHEMDVGHLGLPRGMRARAVLLVPGRSQTPSRAPYPTSRASMIAGGPAGIVSNPGTQMLAGDIGNALTAIIIEARHEGVGPIEAAQNLWNRPPQGPSMREQMRSGWDRDPWYWKIINVVGLSLGGRGDLLSSYLGCN